MKVRTSRVVSLLSIERYAQCPNIECAFTCVIYATITRTIAPSMAPNPKAYLPVSRPRGLPLDKRQMDLLPT